MKKKRFTQWTEVVFGALFILFGIITFIAPSFALSMMAIIYGLIALLSGVNSLVNYFVYERSAGSFFGVSLVVGVINTLVGAYILFNVGAGRSTLSFIFPVWLIIYSVANLASVRQVRFFSGNLAFGLTLAASALGFIVGIFLLLNRGISGMVLVYTLGIYLILQGISSVVTVIMRWRRGV